MIEKVNEMDNLDITYDIDGVDPNNMQIDLYVNGWFLGSIDARNISEEAKYEIPELRRFSTVQC